MMKKVFFTIIILVLATALIGCSDKEKVALEKDILWTNNNIYGVKNKPVKQTQVILEEDCFVSAITNYHYFNKGGKPGTISLIGGDGKKYGPWKAKGRIGQGNVKDAYWDTFPNIQLKAGTYQVIDSNPETWSHNSQSGNSGFTEVRGDVKKSE